ncbi:MAG TPA: hypothetical protein ENI13_00125 [candidate division CPR3 bacterium]|uniref:Uncharacterized protein n=1 Tax=candidate division CPR3 bacterium TaxID=2268181 RepID=A0A7C1NPN9_UNCC3|nr:hypothetical protein [candidate division CPR3 bacterium]
MRSSKRLSKRLSEASREADLPVLGYVVYWSMRGVEIPEEKVESLLKRYRLEEELSPEQTARAALNRALHVATKKKMIRLIDSNWREVVYAVVRESVDKEGQDVSYDRESLVIFDKRNEYIRFKGKHVEEVQRLFKHYIGRLTTHQIRKALIDLVDSKGGVAMRTSGGVYHLGPEHKDLIQRLHGFISEVGNDSYFHYFGIIDSKAAKEALLAAFKEDLKGEISKQRKHLDVIGKRGRSMTEVNVEVGENRFASMKSRVKRVCALTGNKETAFKDQLSQVEALHTNFRSIVARRSATFGKKKRA